MALSAALTPSAYRPQKATPPPPPPTTRPPPPACPRDTHSVSRADANVRSDLVAISGVL